jgi:hypothetical protein
MTYEINWKDEAMMRLVAERDRLQHDYEACKELRAEVTQERDRLATELVGVRAVLVGCQNEADRYKTALEWIEGQTDLFFAECVQAEAIIRYVKNALHPSNEK